MNLAASLRPYYASPVAGFAAFPGSKLEYVRDNDLRTEAEYHWSKPIGSGPRPAVIVQRLFLIDGVAMFGRLWYIRPSWIPKLPPKAIWLRVPCQTTWPKRLRVPLNAAESAHINDERAHHLGIAHYLLRALSFWVERTNDFDEQWLCAPFGSSVVLDAVEIDPKACSFALRRRSGRGRVGETAKQLQERWRLGAMPPCVCIDSLELLKQYNSSTALVRLEGHLQPLVLKCEVEGFGIYHEIKVLLTMRPHDNIIRKPRYLVTEANSDPAEETVCGMLLDHYSLGNLEDHLRPWATDRSGWAAVPMKWAIEIARALIHVSKHGWFCSDLRMDNILLERVGNEDRVVLIDLQMDRNIFAWTPPELLCIEWVKEVASSDDVPSKDRARFAAVWQKFLRLRRFEHAPEMPLRDYDNSVNGWYLPWVISKKQEREMGMVYLLGKVLWCLFEGNGVIGNILGRSPTIEPEIEFGTFKRTPDRVRDLIERMTAGSREWSRRRLGLYRKGALILPRAVNGSGCDESASCQETNQKRWKVWRDEAETALRFLDIRCAIDQQIATPEQQKELGYQERPQLSAVLASLKLIQETL